MFICCGDTMHCHKRSSEVSFQPNQPCISARMVFHKFHKHHEECEGIYFFLYSPMDVVLANILSRSKF